MIKVTITYDTVSEESVQHGDTSDHGFADDHGYLYSIYDDDFQALADRMGQTEAVQYQARQAGEYKFATVRECVDWLRERGPFDSGADRWLTQIDVDDYDVPRFSFHLDGPDPEKETVLLALSRR